MYSFLANLFDDLDKFCRLKHQKKKKKKKKKDKKNIYNTLLQLHNDLVTTYFNGYYDL